MFRREGLAPSQSPGMCARGNDAGRANQDTFHLAHHHQRGSFSGMSSSIANSQPFHRRPCRRVCLRSQHKVHSQNFGETGSHHPLVPQFRQAEGLCEWSTCCYRNLWTAIVLSQLVSWAQATWYWCTQWMKTGRDSYRVAMCMPPPFGKPKELTYCMAAST